MQIPATQWEIPDNLYREILRHLRNDEQLLWLGRPSKDTPMNGLQRLNVTGGIVAIGAFAILGLLTSYWGFFDEVAILIFLGAGIAAGLVLFTISNKQVIERFSTYVLTDRRAFSLVYDNELAVVTSVPLSPRTAISSRLKTPASGSVLFTRIHSRPPDLPKLTKLLPLNNKRSSRLAFSGVQQPEYVVQVALWAAAQNNDAAA